MIERENKLKSILLGIYDFLENGHYDNDPLMIPIYDKIKEALSLFDKDESDTFVQTQPLFHRELIIPKIPNSDLQNVRLDVGNLCFGDTYINGDWVRTSDSTIKIYTYYNEEIYNAIYKWLWQGGVFNNNEKVEAKLYFYDKEGNIRKTMNVLVRPDYVNKDTCCTDDVMEMTFSFSIKE